MAEGGIGLARSQESVDDPDSTSQVKSEQQQQKRFNRLVD